MIDGPAIRADCLECRGFSPSTVSSATMAKDTGWFAKLSTFF
jgi:hypothetical protein